MSNHLSNPLFADAGKAREWLEAHLWPEGPICPHCGALGNATALPTRPGWYQCNASECRSQFTVTVGTLFGREFAGHETVHHAAAEYVRGDAHTNTVEGYFSILKRGIVGTYHHVSQQHLKRYLAEFDFRYNERSALGVEDRERTGKLLKGIVGKRLTYRRTGERPNIEA